jgi:hypothetical protein
MPLPDLDNASINRILGFLGYGNPGAAIWFIGLEEGLGRMKKGETENDEVWQNLRQRGAFDEVMDLVTAHRKLREKGGLIDLENECIPITTQVWIWMARIARAYSGANDWSDIAQAKRFVRRNLGRCSGTSFLTELSPIPCARTKDREWRDYFIAREPSLEVRLRTRAEKLQALLSQHRPAKVICYGWGRRHDFKEFLPPGDWQVVDFSSKVLKSADDRFLILPFLGNGQMSHELIQRVVSAGLLSTKR